MFLPPREIAFDDAFDDAAVIHRHTKPRR